MQKGMQGDRVSITIDEDEDQDPDLRFALELQKELDDETVALKMQQELDDEHRGKPNHAACPIMWSHSQEDPGQLQLKIEKRIVDHALNSASPKASVDALRLHCNYDSEAATILLGALRDKWKDMPVDRKSEAQKSMVLGHILQVRDKLGRKADLKMRASAGVYHYCVPTTHF
jgi:hypothetical protein